MFAFTALTILDFGNMLHQLPRTKNAPRADGTNATANKTLSKVEQCSATVGVLGSAAGVLEAGCLLVGSPKNRANTV